jgi:uncharacterized protein (DUF1697 family)
MPRYVAFLRGVSPMNARMPGLKRCFEGAGFADVKTVLASGNVVFAARKASDAALERRAEAAMHVALGRAFYTIVRPVQALHDLLESDPYAGFALPADAKRVVTFMREPAAGLPALPLVARDGARILSVVGREVFSAYQPSEKGPVFMTLIEQTFGTDITTRTWATVRKCANA